MVHREPRGPQPFLELRDQHAAAVADVAHVEVPPRHRGRHRRGPILPVPFSPELGQQRRLRLRVRVLNGAPRPFLPLLGRLAGLPQQCLALRGQEGMQLRRRHLGGQRAAVAVVDAGEEDRQRVLRQGGARAKGSDHLRCGGGGRRGWRGCSWFGF